MEKILKFCKITGESVKEYDGVRNYVATGDIIENKIINFEKVTYKNKPSRANQNVKIGDVLFAKMKDTQKVIIIDENNVNNIYSTGFFVITPKDNVQSKYLYWLFNSNKFNEQKNKNSKGATQKALNNDGFSKIFIKELPTICEQNKIVDELNKVQEVIDIRKKQIESLEQLIKSQFVEMFEKENKYVYLEEVCTFINGDRGKNYPSSDKISKDSSGIPFINAGLLINNTVDWDNMNYITEETYNKLGSGKIQKEDILYCLRGSLGKHSIIDFNGKGAIASSLVILRADKNKIQPNFLLIQLGMDEIIRQQNQANNGSSQPNLSASSVKRYRIKLPSIEMQNKFVSIVKQIDKQKFEMEKSLKKIEEMYDSLMEKYFG